MIYLTRDLTINNNNKNIKLNQKQKEQKIIKQNNYVTTSKTFKPLTGQNYSGYLSFGMINPILKKSMRSPIFIQMKAIKDFWHELNSLSPKINIKPIQQTFQDNIKQYFENEKNTDSLFNEDGKIIQIAETEERYDNFYHNQHLKWMNFFVENKSCELLESTPDEIFISTIKNCIKKIPQEIEKNNEKLETLKQNDKGSHDIKKEIEKTKKLLQLQQNYLEISDDNSLLIDKESLKYTTAYGIISGLRNKNFIVFKHNISVFKQAIARYLDYQLINPPNLVKPPHPSNKEVSSLSKILGVIPNKPTFSQCMKYAFLEDVYDSTLDFHPIVNNDSQEIGIFTKIPQTKHDDPSFNKRLALMRYLSHSNWCTKFKSASSYLQNSDFYCFNPYEGGRKICLVVKNNEEIHSLESSENSHSLSQEDYMIFSYILSSFPELYNLIAQSSEKDILNKLKQ